MYRQREIENRWLELSGQFPALLLTGPRHVGKTTMLRAVLEPDRRHASLDDPTARSLATQDPALFLQRNGPPVLIDEIQYAPHLLPLIKIAVDEHQQPGEFWLTESSNST